MKLRLTENSIRIRIKKSELEKLATEKRIEEKIHFGLQNVFTFVLTIASKSERVDATFADNYLVVNLPLNTASEWINSNQVGIEVNNSISKEHQLHILIEKDFPCLDRPNEDKSDTFWELASDDPKVC